MTRIMSGLWFIVHVTWNSCLLYVTVPLHLSFSYNEYTVQSQFSEFQLFKVLFFPSRCAIVRVISVLVTEFI